MSADASSGAGSWWVGENLTNQDSFRTGNFFSNNAPSGYEPLQAGNAADAAGFATSLANGSPYTAHNIAYQIAGGPYPSEAVAQAAIPAIQAAHPAPGAAAQLIPGVKGIEEVGHWIAVFIHAITDGKMWRSLGWLILGFILFLAASAWMVKGELTKSIIPGVK